MHTPLWFTIISFNSMAAFIPLSALILYRKPALGPYFLSLFNGLLVAFIDLGAGEVQVPALLLVAFTFFTGFATPGRAWRWGLVTGMWVPVFHFVRMGLQNVSAIPPGETWGSFLALGFALAGAYGGSFIRTLAAARENREHSPLSGSTTVEGDQRRTP